MNNVAIDFKYELPRFWRTSLSMGVICRDLGERKVPGGVEIGKVNVSQERMKVSSSDIKTLLVIKKPWPCELRHQRRVRAELEDERSNQLQVA